MKRDSKRNKKIRKLVVVCSLCAIVLTVSTYAWFIGMKTVNVTKFDVEIATTEGLFLSMDGQSWSYTLDAAGTDITATYSNNTNTWAGTGLIPVSSVGDVDRNKSRLQMYEKGSLTTTKGGYRLLTSRVPNTGDKETNGYVAFDLFIKNLSGNAYYTTNDPLNEEAIYLTTNSSVKVATTNGVAGTGIENSVRVAFAQIGRVSAADGVASVANIQAITCDSVASNPDAGQAQVTGICRNAQIWEPNDKAHVANAINWYTTSCKPRIAGGTAAAPTDVTKDATYDLTGEKFCGTVENGTPNKTYAISRVINVADNVDVYDGAQYNTYTTNTVDYESYIKAKTAAAAPTATDEEKAAFANMRLVDFPYFTDSMKDEPGMARPTFMTLAPNSITKVRVYIYIEGQDIDNYDFASLGKQISINFGFTKERFTETDVGYDPNSPSIDITPVEYRANSTITEISVEGITYDTTNQYFVINMADEVNTFTFKDGDVDKTATRVNGYWTVVTTPTT